MLVYFLPQGTYVLQDNKFSLLTQISSGKQYLDQAPKVNMNTFFFAHKAQPGVTETALCVFSLSTLLFRVAW